MSTAPSIGDYALLGDCHGSALLSRDGSIDWWCAPRFDAPSTFARLLDRAAGHWSIRPVGQFESARHYVDETMVMRTEFSTASGRLALTDALALGPDERGHEIGTRSPHALLRLAEATGEVEIDVEFVPRAEYGLVKPRLELTPDGLQASLGADILLLTSEYPMRMDHDRATARFSLGEGDSAMFVLQHARRVTRGVAPRLDGRAALADTIAGWRSWAEEHRGYDGPFRAQVQRSALVLQALTYQPTGAVVAAATTSLPEVVGGDANWDYRFGWLRDGALTLKALWVAACPDEAERFFDWITASVGPLVDGDHVQIMFGVEGEHDLTEHELPHLAGYRDSKPVRVGNDAWRQKQLDVLGEVLESAWVLRERLGDLKPATKALLSSLADRAAGSWQEKDAGIWEGREGERDYLTSKLMCWVALDRGVRLAPQLAEYARVETWESARQAVRTAILERGWSESAGAYSGAFESDHLDAGVLLMPIMGFLPADDGRMAATIDAIERDLAHDGLVQRWTGSGDEGAFVICSYWLSTCRALAGDVKRAREIFEAVTAHANDLALLAEEIGIRDGALLGNFPQGLSHIGLVNAAWAIQQAESNAFPGDPDDRDQS